MKDQRTLVAIKTLNANSHENDKVRFLQEAAIMGQFGHANVITMHGLVIEEEPVSDTQDTVSWCSGFFTLLS